MLGETQRHRGHALAPGSVSGAPPENRMEKLAANKSSYIMKVSFKEKR